MIEQGVVDYRALVVREVEDRFESSVEVCSTATLPVGSLLVRVSYSSLNYKDALSISGNRGVTKVYPHTPGIDAAGVVVSCDSELFSVGDAVIVTGYELGMSVSGGYGEYIRVPAEWALPLPKGLSLKEAMIYGTAGLTAGLSLFRLRTLVQPSDGGVLVTGATGGVGSMSVAMLSKLGYTVTAITGKREEEAYLKSIGASEVLLRSDFMAEEPKALLASRYAGAIDTVGGELLAQVLRQVSLYGGVTCCGNVVSPDLHTSIYPFILRGISLMGISAQHSSSEMRAAVWHELANDWKPEGLQTMCSEISLAEVAACAAEMLKGGMKRRCLVCLDK